MTGPLLVADDVEVTVVVGEPGVGKSIACLAAAQVLATAGTTATATRIPLLIPADSWSPRCANLAEWAVDRIRATFTDRCRGRDAAAVCVPAGASALAPVQLAGEGVPGFRTPRPHQRNGDLRLLLADAVRAVAGDRPCRRWGLFALLVTRSLVLTHWGTCVSACLMSWARGHLPLRLIRFLDDTSRLGILHRVGSSYYFKHAALYEHLRQA
jgi:hypothetical protein